MVVLHLRRGSADDADGGGDAFLYETSCATAVDVLITELVRVWCVV